MTQVAPVRSGGVLVIALLLPSASAFADAPSWTFSVPDSLLAVRTEPKRSALFSGLAHPHLVHARNFSGTLAFEPGQPESCKIEIEINVADLVCDDPVVRKRAGLAAGPDESDRKKIDKNMRDDDQIDSGRFPKIGFHASGCRASKSADTILVAGELSIRGKSKHIEVPMKFKIEGDKLSVNGELGLTHGDFGFEPYSAALGTIANAEGLKFLIQIVALRAQ